MSIARGTLLVVSLMASGAAYAGTPGWSVSEVSGPVFVGKPGLSKTSTVTRGAALSAGDIVSTGKGGRAVIVRGGEYLTVAPNTQLQLTEPKAGAFTQIVQSFGNVVFKIQKKTTPHFQVKTPYLAAVVKGTTFSVTVTPAGASVQVTEGLVQVASLDGLASRFVSPGEIGMISASAPGKLSVLGTPNAPSGGAAVIGAAPVADAPTSETSTEPAAAPVSDVAEVRIASPIGEGSVNLAAQTGGIVSGNSSLAQAAIVEAVAVETPVTTNTATRAEVSLAVAETSAPEAAPPVLETPTNLLAEAPASPPTPTAVAEVVAQSPVEVAVAIAPPVEQTSPPVELPVEVAVVTAPPVEQALPPVELPVEVAVVTAPPVEQALTPVELPVEVAVVTAPPVEQALPPVELPVEVAMVTAPPVEKPSAPMPPMPVTPGEATPVLVAVNNSPTPVEGGANPTPPASIAAVDNANPNSTVITKTADADTPRSNSGNSPSSDRPNSENSSETKVTAVAENAAGKKKNENPLTLSEFLQRLRVAAQQLAANRKGN